MIVVADTSPLNYLVQIGLDKLIPALYKHVLVPSAVIHELGHPHAPEAVRAWLDRFPLWVDVHPAADLLDETLSSLGYGEREAIHLAVKHRAGLLLIDERKGNLEAQRRGLITTGTLGVLLGAGELRLIDPVAAYRRLLTTTTFITSAAVEARFAGRSLLRVPGSVRSYNEQGALRRKKARPWRNETTRSG